MQANATLQYLRIAPRKVRLVADLVRNMNVAKAQYNLDMSTKRASDSLLKLLNSAIANAKNDNEDITPEQLFIWSAYSDTKHLFLYRQFCFLRYIYSTQLKKFHTPELVSLIACQCRKNTCSQCNA